jgi:hypothetical protein
MNICVFAGLNNLWIYHLSTIIMILQVRVTRNFLLLACFWTVAASKHCSQGYFWNTSELKCQACTVCPPNQNFIIREPCSRDKDTVCGHFTEFSSFNQIKTNDESFVEFDSVEAEEYGDIGSNDGHSVRLGGSRSQNEPIVEKDDGEYWKNLAFALIGMVCILIIVATVVVLIACRKLHRTNVIKRPDEEEGG